jgi:thiol:disulfide interchange protein DsbD
VTIFNPPLMNLPASIVLTRLLIAVAAMLTQSSAFGADLLEPKQAFRFSARVAGPDVIEVRYRIADGYYLYRDKFRFSVAPDSFSLGQPDFPPGNIIEDEFFGKSETYRRNVTIRIPVQRAAGLKAFTLRAVSQGCADVGVCYVPLTQTARLYLGG